MTTTHLLSRLPASARAAAGLTSVFLVCGSGRAQLPPELISAFNNTVGARVEALDVLGGDFGLSGGHFQTTGNSAQNTEMDTSKFGGGGDVGDPKPLGNTGIGWQPRLQGSVGDVTATKHFDTGVLAGDKNKFDTFAIQFGGGARFWLNEHLSLAPTIMGMYGYTKNEYTAKTGSIVDTAVAKQQGLIDWDINTWTVRPAMNAQYVFTLDRTLITLNSDFSYFHTESFSSTSSFFSINGNSESWRNMIDVDIPLGKQLFGHELRTGGFIARTEFYDDLKTGLNTDHLYEAHGRVALDFLNELWKVQWIGLGGSYMWGSNFNGYSFGADIAFRF